MYNYKAKINKVVDADTIDATVDVGFSINVTHRFRIKNYDAPETYRPINEAELKHGREATILAKTLLLNKTVTLTTYKGIGIYGRYIADVTLDDGKDYASLMKERGFEKLEDYSSDILNEDNNNGSI